MTTPSEADTFVYLQPIKTQIHLPLKTILHTEFPPYQNVLSNVRGLVAAVEVQHQMLVCLWPTSSYLCAASDQRACCGVLMGILIVTSWSSLQAEGQNP